MIPPIPTLQEYGLSSNLGFLPGVDPVSRLSSHYYEPWEKIADDLPTLAKNRFVRGAIEALPLLDLCHLLGEAEWRRAYVILGFMVHAYIWSGDKPAECLPRNISIPLLELSQHFETPPVATYSTVCLWNYRSIDPSRHLDLLSNLRTVTSFTGTRDEEWFYLISVAIEARGARSIPMMLNAIAAARENDSSTVIEALRTFTDHITDLGELLTRLYEECDPDVFYFKLRPFLAGSKNMEESGLPRGVLYEDRAGNKTWHKHSGGSNAQSSLIQAFDIILGVEHRQTGEKKHPSSEKLQGTAPPAQNNFIQDMRTYMPGSHRRFLEHLTTVANIKDYVTGHQQNRALVSAYDSTLSALAKFRSLHIQIVTRYIIQPSTAEKKRVAAAAAAALSKSSLSVKRLPQAMVPTDIGQPRQGLAKDEASKNGLIGTGGTQLIPFLKQARDETTEPAIGNLPMQEGAGIIKRPVWIPRTLLTLLDLAMSTNLGSWRLAFFDLREHGIGLIMLVGIVILKDLLGPLFA